MPKNKLPFLFQGETKTQFPGDVLPEKTTKFFILGSQHNLPSEFLHAELQTIIDESDVLVKEVTDGIFGDAGDISLKELKLHGLILDDKDENWTQLLSKDASAYFHCQVKPSMVNAWGIEPHRISPVVVNHVISEWTVSEQCALGMDAHIQNQFVHQQKPILALENGKTRFDADDTLFAFNDMHTQTTMADSVALLEETIRKNQEIPGLIPKAKTREDFEHYFAFDLDNASTSKDFRDLYKRNLSWITTMERYLTDHAGKTILFMCGYAHIGGTYGIVNLLRNLGYSVERVLAR